MTLALVVAMVLGCGEERWAVKTLADGFAPDGGAVAKTIAQLTAETPPKWEDQLPRQPLESTVVAVNAGITGYKLESDEDFHVVISDGQRTMIVEFPSPDCTADPTLRKARADFLKLVPHRPLPRFSHLHTPIAVHLVGVPFFDKLHGQAGVAPNGIELHPVLSIEPASPTAARKEK